MDDVSLGTLFASRARIGPMQQPSVPTRHSGSAGGSSGVCPHVNRNDLRCSSRFSLNRLNQAFDVCFGAYDTCPMFRMINRELREDKPRREAAAAAAEPVAPIITITARGRAVSLRPTGT